MTGGMGRRRYWKECTSSEPHGGGAPVQGGQHERRRLGPLIRNLRRATDPLFRRAGIDLDGEGP